MRKLTQEEYETLEECVSDELTRYSGRAMYGVQCLGIISDDSEKTLFLLGIALAEHESKEANVLIEILTKTKFCADSMGRDSTVTYFPSIELPDGVLNEDYEDEE